MVSKKFRSLIIAGATLLSSSSAFAAVWPSENSWSQEWEDRYSEWVKNDWDEKFFARPNTPYTGLHLDCADVVYSMRVIFSYENKLPFAMKDPTGGKKLITNEMTRFDHLPADKRIRQFLIFIYNTGSTQSLPNDTVPIAVNRQNVRSGALILTNKESHHSWTIKKVLPTGIPHLIYSSRPAKNTLLVRIDQPSVEFTFKNNLDPATNAGFRAFRKLDDLGKPAWQSAGYSDEQYKIPIRQWKPTVKARLSLVNESPEAELKRLLKLTCTEAQERVTAVNEGLAARAEMGNRCMNAEEYDNFSTPNRDMRMRNAFEDLRDAANAARSNAETWSKLSPEVQGLVNDVFSDQSPVSENERYCAQQIAPGKYLSLGQIRARALSGRLSDNPNDGIEERWGERKGHSAKAKRCPTHG